MNSKYFQQSLIKNSLCTFVLFVVLLSFCGCVSKGNGIAKINEPNITESELYAETENFTEELLNLVIEYNGKRYFRFDKYGFEISTNYNVLSSEVSKEKAGYYENDSYTEMTVKVFEGEKFISWHKPLLDIVLGNILFCRSDVANLPYLENSIYRDKMIIEHNSIKESDNYKSEVPDELSEEICSLLYQEYCETYLELKKHDNSSEEYVITIFLKDCNASVDVGLISYDTDGKIGVLTDDNFIIPLSEKWQGMNMFTLSKNN